LPNRSRARAASSFRPRHIGLKSAGSSNERDILFISDEVICGFGRTGEWFGADTYGTKPDLMAIAKGMTSGYLPMGGVIVSPTASLDVLHEKGGEFFHGYTYSGHPAACAAAIANLNIMKRENWWTASAIRLAPISASAG
jgi:adenosylmethionine-8-amino-7-oxononanoate aminotransferase